MAICFDCKREMTAQATTACTFDGMMLNGKEYPRIPFAGEPDERCHDCNVAVGGLHHYGCDVEECPCCHRQLIACNCTAAAKPHQITKG